MPAISLSLPKSWDALSTTQLEGVSQLLISTARAYTQTGQFSHESLMVQAFFLLSGLEPISPCYIDDAEGNTHLADDRSDPMQTYFLCQYRDEAERQRQQTIDGRIADIKIFGHEIHTLAIGGIDPKALDSYLRRKAKRDVARDRGQQIKGEDPEPPQPKGALSWLLAPSTRTIVPYPELTLPDAHHADRKLMERWLDPHTLTPATRRYPATVTLTGPSELMQDFSWRQFRFASDLRTYLTKVENHLVQMQRRKMPAQRIEQQQQIVQQLRAEFLATLYTRPVLYTDPDTQQLTYAPRFLPDQPSRNAYLFLTFPEHQFQAIDFWWQGMQHYLQRQYPKVFRTSDVKPLAPTDDNPLTLYTRSTTTMIKYAASNEREVNETTYTIILQHIQDMADENDRIKEMSK